MVVKHSVEGYENFCELVKNLYDQGKQVHVYFGGSKLENGESWCDDCVRAAPVIENALTAADPKSHFIYCAVGDRSTWKDPNCPFRKDLNARLIVLPTVLRWQKPQRLEGDQCESLSLLEMLFGDEEY